MTGARDVPATFPQILPRHETLDRARILPTEDEWSLGDPLIVAACLGLAGPRRPQPA